MVLRRSGGYGQRGFGGRVGMVLALAAGVCGAGRAAETAPSLAESDKQYAQQSYAKALLGYETAQKAGLVPADRKDLVAYRIAVSLGKTQQWDRALTSGVEFVKTHRGTIWEARGLYWLGRQYLATPHDGYRVGKKITRGQNVPKVEGDEKPVRLELSTLDQQNSHDALEAAFLRYADRSAADAANPAIVNERILLDYDLIHQLQAFPGLAVWAQKQAWLPPNDDSWNIDPTQPYDPQWPLPKKSLYLYSHLDVIAAANPHQRALALIYKALWLRQYQAQMSNYAVKYELGKPIKIPYPYQDMQPGTILGDAARLFPADPLADQALYLQAIWMAQDGKWQASIELLNRLIATRPRSKWVNDARAQLAEFHRSMVSVEVVGTPRPGASAKLQLNYRNLSQAHLDIYRLDMAKLLAARSDKTEDGQGWVQLDNLLSTRPNKKKPKITLPAALAANGAARVASWNVNTTNKGDMRPRSETIVSPIKEPGAYVVVASCPGQRYGALMMVSDLVLIQKTDRIGGLFYAADARTGKPRGGVNLLVKQWWQTGDKYGVSFRNAVTNADGVVSVPLQRAANRTGYRLAALAHDGNRFAYTDPQDSNEYGAAPEGYKVYSTTDRTVYRPQQMVRFRQLVMQRGAARGVQRGEMRPVVGKMVRVVVSDPQGNVVYKQRSQCSEFGSVSGQFALPAKAPLGEYTIGVTLPTKANAEEEPEAAGNRFRVEEYKKPEFEVTITPTAERVKLGQPTNAKIHAAYYFGGPVPGAKVTYRVYRNLYAATYRFPQPYDYLYHNNQGEYDTNYRNGEVVAQGKTRLDAQGDSTITFDTKATGDRWGSNDLSYTVEADVQDQSRRVISGTGALKATKHDVAVFLNYPHGYATQGDRVDIEVKTLNPSDQPVAVRGTAKVFQQPLDSKGKEILVDTMLLRTDAQGHGEIQWTAKTSGHFRISYETQDSDGGVVSGDVEVWVDGLELRGQRFLFQGVFLAVKNPYYQEGQSAHILLVTPEPGCSVLLTREAEGQILDKRVIRIPGRSLEVNVPITRRDVPNVFLSAIMVRNGEMFEATQELFVPPAQQTARVTVKADKAKYQPGETAHLLLTARDVAGKPLRAELSVSVADAALNYIQKDYAPDIRAYFYGDRRSNNMQTFGSMRTSIAPVYELTEPIKTYPRHNFEFPAMGQIPVSPYESYQAQAQWSLAFNGEAGGRTHFSMGFADGHGRFKSAPGGTGGLGGGGAGGNLGILYSQDYDEAPRDSAGAGRPSLHTMRRQFAAKSVMAARPSMPMMRGMPASGGPQEMKKEDTLSVKVAEARIRSDFRDTAFWTPAVVTDAQGNATITVKWPDNLTQWRAQAVGSTQLAQVGVGETKVTTKKDLLVQLETPRFTVERDVVVFSAVVHNDTDRDSRIRVKLDLDNADVVSEDIARVGEGVRVFGYSGIQVFRPSGVGIVATLAALCSLENDSICTLLGQKKDNSNDVPEHLNTQTPEHLNTRLRVKTSETWVIIPKGGQQRVDWLVRPKRDGVLHVRMTAQSDVAGDAAQTIVPVLVHGVEKTTMRSGVLKSEDMNTANTAKITISLPEARKAGQSQLLVTLNPSLAGVMLDALPYLADYPYGCVEQTMSRFLPSVLVARTLQDVGYNLGDLEKAAKAQRLANSKKIRTPKVDNSPYTYPTGGKIPQFPITDSARMNSPVFNSAELNKMVKDGLARLREFQHADGGWGWWKDDGSDTYMTTYVVYGLIAGQKAGYVVPGDELARGLTYLQKRYLEETDLQQMAYQARVLALVPEQRPAIVNRVEKKLYPQRAKLSAYGKALLALALNDLGRKDQAKIVLDNIENTAHVDAANGTANWDDLDGSWWRWYNNKVETNATILQAYMAIAPDAKLPPMLVKWLVNNRRGTIWHDTHDTSLAVNALADWMRVKKELAPDYTLTVDLGGRIQRKYRVNHENALFFDNTFVVSDTLLQTGDQTLTITRQGKGTCYYAATTQIFSEEEPITGSGNEIGVTRRYFRLIPETVKGTEQAVPAPVKPAKEVAAIRPNPFLTGEYDLLDEGGEAVVQVVQEEGTEQGPQYKRVAVAPGEMLNSGDLLEVELSLESKNDYDYVIFEDIKPAGCEPVELRSGDHAGQGVYSNMELRDEKVAFFLTQMPQGRRTLTYRLRAEIPGAFHVLPTNGYAMYAPDVRTISDETRLSIRDEEASGEIAPN